MEVTDGSLSWAATLDDSQMASASDQIEQYFRSIGMSAVEANIKTEEAMKMMAKAVNDALEEAGTGAEAIDVLNAAIENMKQQLASMPEGEMRQTLEGVVQGFEDVRDEMSRTIQETGQLGDSFGNASDILVKLLGGTENYSKIIGGLPGPLRSAISGIKGMTTAARAFIATPLGAIIAAIVLALQAMRAWLTSSAEGEMRLAETTGYLKGILGQLKEIVIDLGEWLVKAFDDPQAAVKDLGSKIKDNLMNRLTAVGEIGQAIGKILKAAFDLDSEGLKEGATQLMGSIVQFNTGLDKIKFAEKVLGIGKAAEEKSRIERERLELEVEQSKWNVRRAELEKLMADANAKMYNTSLGSAERKNALDEYKRYNQEILDSEEAIINKKIDLQERDMALTTNSIEDENELRELQAERWRIRMEASQRLATLQRRENSIENAGQSAAQKSLKLKKMTEAELLKLTQSNREKELELKRDGYAKELEAAKVAYTKEIEEVGKLEKKWMEAQGGVLSGDQQAQLDKARKLANDTLVKNNADVLREMLTEYGDYTAQKEAIDEQYYDNVALLDKMMAESTSENQRKALQAAKEMAGKNRARDILGLGLDKVNSTTYGSVGARMAAINDVYAQYIASLQLAGASEHEINKAKAEQVALTGKVAVIEAQIADLEQQRTLLDIADPKDAKEIERLNREIARLKKQLDLINGKQGSKGVWADFMASLDVQEVTGWLNGIGDAITRIGEAAGSTGIKDAGEAISGIAKAAQGVAQGFAQGGLIGAAVSLVSTIGSEIVDFIATESEMERALSQAKFDKFVSDQRKVLEGFDSIFGENSADRANASLVVINEATKKLRELENQLISFDEQRRNAFFIFDRGSFMSMLDAYNDAVSRGIEGVASVAIRTKDRSGFANWFGFSDEFKSLEDAVKDLGYTLYDENGMLNKEALQAVLDNYKDLGEEERSWIEKVISDLKLYEDASAKTAEYLKSLFGDMADTMADQIVEDFMQGKGAAIDFGKTTSDVARQMAKDFVKSMLLTDVFGKYEKQFKSIMMREDMDLEEKQKAMLAYFSAMQADADALQPEIQAYLETMRQFFGEEAEISSQSGNLLQNATQDSVDLVNGQMNAIRMNQMRIADAIDSVLISISGLREDMNRGFGESVNLLRGIENNTGNTNNSVLRGFGLQ